MRRFIAATRQTQADVLPHSIRNNRHEQCHRRVIVHGPLPSFLTQRFALHHARGLSAPATGARCAVETTRRGDTGARRSGRRGRSLRERRKYLSQKTNTKKTLNIFIAKMYCARSTASYANNKNTNPSSRW